MQRLFTSTSLPATSSLLLGGISISISSLIAITLLAFPSCTFAKSHKHPPKIVDPHDPHAHSTTHPPPLPLTFTNRILTLLSNPPTSLSTFLLSLVILSILTYLGQKSAAKVTYALGWIYRRLQGDSAYEEGVKVPGFDSEDDDDGEMEYSVDSDVGKILDYVVTVDEKKKFGIQGSVGGDRGGGMRVRKVGGKGNGETTGV